MASEVIAPAPTTDSDGAGGPNGSGAATKPSSSSPMASSEVQITAITTTTSPLFAEDSHIASGDVSVSEEEEGGGGGGGEAQDEGDEHEGAPSSSPHQPHTVTSPVTSPPYWPQGQQQAAESRPRSNGGWHLGGGGGGGGGLVSNGSSDSVVHAGAITMQDNETEEDQGGGHRAEPERLSFGRDRNRACWARSVSVTDHVVVNGSATHIGAFVVWNIRVETLNGPYMNIRKRYSEFDDLRQKLVMTFPNFEAAVPPLPPKSVIAKFRPKFLEKRRSGLQYFLNCILLNPEFSGSPVLKDFLFS